MANRIKFVRVLVVNDTIFKIVVAYKKGGHDNYYSEQDLPEAAKRFIQDSMSEKLADCGDTYQLLFK